MRRLLLASFVALIALTRGAPAASAAINPGPHSAAPCAQMVWTIDVSRWQGHIDWVAVAGRGVAGAWIKTSGADGGYYRDPMAGTNMVGATNAGLPWGTYHFAQPNWDDAGAQADYAVSQGFAKGLLPPVLDLEWNPKRLSGAELDNWALAFLRRTTEVTGRVPIVYSGAWFAGFGNDPALAAYPFWIANYGTNTEWSNPCQRAWPPVPNAWRQGFAIWQHNSTTHIPGIAVNSVDQNIVTPEAWAQWTGAGVETNPSPTNDPAAAEQVQWHVGARGPKVAQIQRIVGATVDGEYGPRTVARVAGWQRFLGVVPADGAWGPDTERRTGELFDALARTPVRRIVQPAGPVAPGSVVPRATIARGARGDLVCTLQGRLVARGYWLRTDCVFGPATARVVVDWQARQGLVRDGIVGPATWKSLG